MGPKMVHGVPPFPWVRESLGAIAGEADMIVVSATPVEALRREWEEHDLELVANSERCFPRAWIAPSRTDVTDEFLDYALPLIGSVWPSVPLAGGMQRFARLAPVLAERKLPEYVPQAYRGAAPGRRTGS